MKIETVHRIYDDSGKECKVGDMVLLQTKDMDDMVQAQIEDIKTTMATFLVDDRAIGWMPIKVRCEDVVYISKYNKDR